MTGPTMLGRGCLCSGGLGVALPLFLLVPFLLPLPLPLPLSCSVFSAVRASPRKDGINTRIAIKKWVACLAKR